MNYLSQTRRAADDGFHAASTPAVPKLVQPFGAVMVLDGAGSGEWTIVRLSANCGDVLGVDHQDLAGSRAGDLFAPEAIQKIAEALNRPYQSGVVERVISLRLLPSGDLFDCAIHIVDALIILEFEPHIPDSLNQGPMHIAPILTRLSAIEDCDALCDEMRRSVRDLFGYDHVTIRRFPAPLPVSYNRVHMIADHNAQPVSMEPESGDHIARLDFTRADLRIVAPQGGPGAEARATLDIALVRDGQVWGMIGCAHGTARLISASERALAETLSLMLSAILDKVLIQAEHQRQSRGQALHHGLMLRLTGGVSLAASLPTLSDIVEEAIAHDGMSILLEGEYQCIGNAPDETRFAAHVTAFSAKPTCTAFIDSMTGALVVPISRHPRDYLVMWRRTGMQAQAWSDDDVLLAEGLRVTLIKVVLRMTGEIARERKRSQEQQELLIAELNHRVRNILNLIRSLVSQSQKDAQSVTAFANIIGGRIAALSSAHDNITRENWAPAPLSALFETEMAAYIGENQGRFVFVGGEVLIKPEAYTVLALVVHELVTNSAKYGALSNDQGQVRVRVVQGPSGDLTIGWREYGGPAVKPPARRGFGSTIIERSIPFELSGEARLVFKLTGVEADFRVPTRFIESILADPLISGPIALGKERKRHSNAHPDAVYGPNMGEPELPAARLPAHVLVVEDSMIIAIDTEENLKRLGVQSVKVESNVRGALKAIEEQQPDFAIVDYNLGNENSVPVTQALQARGIRFVLATGYSEGASQFSELGAAALLRKPYGQGDIKAMLIAQD